MSNSQAFLRFKEFLELRQLAHQPGLDIRSHVLSLTKRNVAIGYVSATLDTKFGANLKKLFPDAMAIDDPDIANADAYLSTGTIYEDAEKSHTGAVRLFNSAPPDKEILLFESAFLATTHSWAHSFKQGNPAFACLGYVYDDIAHYFMADYPNRLIEKLNSDDTPAKEELARARALMRRILKKRISKYNAQPMYAPAMADGYARRVLVCDQAYADASTVYGKVGDAEFEQMLLSAIVENPDAEILVKTHPDSVWEKEKRTGYYAHLQSTKRVRMLRDPINPYTLFDLVDTVYVGTSQMGFEALLAGKKVVTFGAPFYAGWGLTDDRQTIPHRHRARKLVEIFHYFYVWYTIYHLPGRPGAAEIEDVLDYIEKNRPYALPPTRKELAAPPKVSVVIPVHGTERYIEECISSVQRQSLRNIEIIPVNDASPDNSQAIIDRLASADARIHPIILSENVGQGFARNRGIDAARGEYLWFLDADDWLVDSDFLKRTAAAAEANQAEMTRAKKAGEAVFDADDNLLTIKEDRTERFFETDVPVTDYRSNPDLLHSRHFCLWLYRRAFLNANEIRFVTTQWEERAFLLKALLRAKTISLTTNRCFMYRIRLDSTARREKHLGDVENMLQNVEQICALLKEHAADDRQSEYRQHLNFQLSQFLHILFFGFWYRVLEAGSAAPYDALQRLATALRQVDFCSSDLTSAPLIIDKARFDSGVYHLIVAALRSDRLDWLPLAVWQRAVPQERLYEEFMAEPDGSDKGDFQAALNVYARNGQVQTAARAPEANPPTRPRVVVHIGATKTGSTFIQHTLEKNRPALLRKGVWFPEVGLFWQPTRPHKQAGHSEFTRAAVDGDPALRDYIRRGLDLMEGRIHTIVLSSEAFFLQENAPRLADYFEGHPLEMVVYLRRQDEWANSQYCEFVAGGAVGRVDLPIDQWLKQPKTERLLDYRNPISGWRDKIGSKNIRVRVFERSRFVEGDLLADFAAAANLPQLTHMPRPDALEQNEARLSTAHVGLLRLFNARPFAGRDEYFNFIEEVGTEITRWRQENGISISKPWMLDAAQADALMARYDKANAAIARDYLGTDAPMFGPRNAPPEQSSLQQEEFALVERIYAKYARSPDLPEVVIPADRTVVAKPQPAPVIPPKPRIVNYGLFGWRLWLLTPILAALYANRASPDRLREFLTEPFAFSRRHWVTRHPFVTWLLYPGGSPMGPLGIFRVWVPVARRLVRLTGRADMLAAFNQDPILFARNLRRPLRRLLGRVMFPIGEVRTDRQG